jgi:hypothetical protein
MDNNDSHPLVCEPNHDLNKRFVQLINQMEAEGYCFISIPGAIEATKFQYMSALAANLSKKDNSDS